MGAGRAVAWWRGWVSADPRAVAPGRIESRYRVVKAALGRHGTLVDAAPALATAACTVPQLTYHATHPGGRFGEYLVFTVLLVVPLVWRRRFPLSTFAWAALVALAEWIAGVELSADVGLLVYLYTVASL